MKKDARVRGEDGSELPTPQTAPTTTSVCPRCLEILIKIRQGKLTGVVLSCHPLDEIADVLLKPHIESRNMRHEPPPPASN